jgi:hypothetical protein
VHGRPRAYSEEFTQALRVLWEATCYVCAERLQPFMGELADLLVRHHQLEISEAIRAQLDQASVSTVERHLHGLRVEVRGRRRSYGRPGAVLRREIPVLVAGPATMSSSPGLGADVDVNDLTSPRRAQEFQKAPRPQPRRARYPPPG